MSADDVKAIADRYLDRVKKCGPENVMAICPFHEGKFGGAENTPSFTMSLTRGVYYCFACHEKGTLRRFLRRMGVNVDQIDGEYKYVIEETKQYRQAPYDPLRPRPKVEPLPESLLGIFESVPVALLEEGFDEQVLYDFDIGYDSTHQRITFPLRNLEGELIGISGRAEDGVEPRYKVYDKEYLAWGLSEREMKKGTILWNAHSVLAEVFFGAADCVNIVEGFKACMWLVQNGITTTVALLGSYMSRDQMSILEQLAPREVCLMLDNDKAGYDGTIRIGQYISRRLSRVYVAEYEAAQPSDIDIEEIETALSNRTPYHTWRMQLTAPQAE